MNESPHRRQGKGRQADREQGPAKHGALKPPWEGVLVHRLVRNQLTKQTGAAGAFSKEHPQI